MPANLSNETKYSATQDEVMSVPATGIATKARLTSFSPQLNKPQPTPKEIKERYRTEITVYADILSFCEGAFQSIVRTDDIPDAMEILEHLKTHIAQCRANRLVAVKPFKDMVKQVENTFQGVESAMSEIYEKLRRELGKRLPENEVEWEISNVAHAEINWDELGPYFSTAAVNTAAKKHLKDTRLRSLSGVEYRPLAIVE